MTTTSSISRRSFIGASALGTAALTVPLTVASAAETPAAPAVPAWLGEAPAISDRDCAETVDVEVVVVGAGNSGTFCAAYAADLGVNVLLIEANEKPMAIRSSGIGAVDSRWQIEHNAQIDKEAIITDFQRYSTGYADAQLIRQWADNSGEAVNWYGDILEANGYTFKLEYGMPPAETTYPCWPTGHNTVCQDPSQPFSEQDVFAIMQAFIEERGGSYRNCTRMQSLIQDESGKVVGVYATNADGDPIRINVSKAVVVATGGYVNNPEMFIARQGGLEKSFGGPLNYGCSHGDGIKALLWAGAHMDPTPTTMVFDRAAVKPDQELGHIFDGGMDFYHFTFCTQPFMKVDQTGKRICAESSPYDFIVHNASNRPGRAWYSIWDNSWREDVERFWTIGCSTLFAREGSNNDANGTKNLDSTAEAMAKGVEQGYIMQADTLEELAQKLGLTDVDAFMQQVADYNSYYEAGYDAQFAKDSFRLSAIDEPPYYGVKIGGEPLCTLDGVVINPNYQPLDDRNEPIEGVYVIGNDSGCYYNGTYPNLSAGQNAGRMIAAAMLVAKALA